MTEGGTSIGVMVGVVDPHLQGDVPVGGDQGVDQEGNCGCGSGCGLAG